jgi:Bacterial archaeo-eukaryotic release factor family 3
MNATKSELVRFESLKDLRDILASEGPCITIYMPLSNASTAGINPNAKQNELSWRDAVQTARNEAERLGAQGKGLVDSIGAWKAVAQDQDPQARSVVVFRSRDVYAVSWLHNQVPARVRVGPHFYVRPLLAALAQPSNFYILALSQKDTRLLRCTNTTSEEVPFNGSPRLSFDVWMNAEKRDHNDRDRGAVGPSSGHNKAGAIAPMGSDTEAKSEFLSHYFKFVDAKVNDVLKDRKEPLVVAAVEYEQPIYREVSRYPGLVQEAVIGAANSLKAGEMHARGLEALQREYDRRIDEALGLWDHRVGAGASSRPTEVVKAAQEGRILTLLISDRLELTGLFDEASHKMIGRETGGPEDEDLVNRAAVQTILHAGNVLVAPHNKMPNGAATAAIYRFQAASA